MMHFKLVCSVIALLAFSTSVNAADLPSRSVPPVYTPPPPIGYSWNGIYVGGSVGYGFTRDSVNAYVASTNTYFTSFSNPDYGVIGGGQIGYNFVVAPHFLIGVEADFLGTGVHGGTAVTTANGTGTLNTNVDWFGTVRGRVGYILPNNWLLYATGGFAYLRDSDTNVQTACSGRGCIGAPLGTTAYFSQMRTGFAVGAGIEVPIYDHWTVKAEYIYTDFGTAYTNITPTFDRYDYDRLQMHTFKVGVNYKFDWFAPATPVVAKY